MTYQIPSDYLIFIIITEQHFKRIIVVFCHLFVFFTEEDNKNKRKRNKKTYEIESCCISNFELFLLWHIVTKVQFD
jgi:hypothetical protein